MKRVLVACEYSQVVTEAFRAAGALAYSCDLEPCAGNHPEWHFQQDVTPLLSPRWEWDLIVAHPPCTYLARVSGQALRIDALRWRKLVSAREFFYLFWNYEGKIAIENPYPLNCAQLPPYNQVVCPSEFGHEYTKHCCLWLKDLPPLLPTTCRNIKAESWVKHCAGNGKRRARFWSGIAQAMAEQWLPLI